MLEIVANLLELRIALLVILFLKQVANPVDFVLKVLVLFLLLLGPGARVSYTNDPFQEVVKV